MWKRLLPAMWGAVPESLAPEVVRFLQAKLPEWMSIDQEVGIGGRARPGMIGARDASRKLGLSDPTVGQFLKDGKGGMKFLRAVARLRYGKEDITRLEDEARVWAEQHQPAQRFVIPEHLDRVLIIAERLDRSAADARRVALDLAAYTGAITDKEIASRFSASTVKKRPVEAVEGEDDLGHLEKKPRRRR